MSTSGIEAANTINQAYGDANASYYNKIGGQTVDADGTSKSIGSPQNLAYYEYKQSSNPILTEVGCVCNTENTNFNFDTAQYWNSDTIPNDIQNAQKIINDLEWVEQSKLHNSTDGVKIKPGLVVLNSSANGYNINNVNYFNNIVADANRVVPNFNTYSIVTGGGNSIALDFFGYFHPDKTGAWTFNLPSTDATGGRYSYLWMGDTALYDYIDANADINANTPQTSAGNVSATFTLNKDDYIPFRIQIISKNSNMIGPNKPFTVTPPQGSAATSLLTDNPTTGWNYFVTFINGNAIYYKKLLYFGLVKPKPDVEKYNCHFVSITDNNLNYIKNNKMNAVLQYIKAVIPAPVSFNGRATIKVQDNQDLVSPVYPIGTTITIESARYGYGDEKFKYTAKTQALKPKTFDVAAGSTTSTAADSDQYIPSRSATVGNSAYSYSKNTLQDDYYDVYVPQWKTVTDTLQKLVVSDQKGTYFKISKGTYESVLGGNPITDPNDTNINQTKTIIVTYSYSANPDSVTNKHIYLDPTNATLMVGFTFGSFNASSPMKSMSKTYSCTDNCSSYSLQLIEDDTTVRLAITDSDGAAKNDFNLSTYDRTFDMNTCMVNTEWHDNLGNATSISAGESNGLSVSSGSALYSKSGRFKLAFENGFLTLTYCRLPYLINKSVADGAGKNIKYTEVSNVNNMIINGTAITNSGQILYLYRINNTKGLFGKKFLQEVDTNIQTTTMHYLPNTYTNVLKKAGYQPFSQTVFPLMKNNDITAYTVSNDGTITKSDNYTIYKGVKDQATCENYCSAVPDNKCEHYFYLNTNYGNTCYVDKIGDANPAYTTTNDPSVSGITSSQAYKKKYTITTTCGTLDNNRPLQYKDPNENIGGVNAVTIDYRMGDNAPNLTYYCSLDRYKQDEAVKSATYNTYTPPSDVKVGGTEGFDPTIGSDANTIINTKLPDLQSKVAAFGQTQDQIGVQYDQTIRKLQQYVDISNSMTNVQYKFNSTDSIIPEKFVRNLPPKPNVSYTDGMKKDVGIMLVQQNTMYTLASITAATCLILGVAFGWGGGEG